MFEQELEIGKQAVIESMRLCREIQQESLGRSSIKKLDKSPVTIADFISQAIICHALTEHFPRIPIVAEEHSGVLRKSEHEQFVNNIFYFIEKDKPLRTLLNRGNLFRTIDLGCGETNTDMFWALDPVDGTLGFLRGAQFAVALALVVKGRVHVGILGCPHFELPGQPSAQGYCLFAVRGQGAHVLNVETGRVSKIEISTIRDPANMRMVESVEPGHGDLDRQLKIARALKLNADPWPIDSQAKYGVLATGNAEIYLRLPKLASGYKEKIWDHAAGSLILEEAGGKVTDMHGKELDFTQGKTLKANNGIVASVPSVHQLVLETIKAVPPVVPILIGALSGITLAILVTVAIDLARGRNPLGSIGILMMFFVLVIFLVFINKRHP
ncbi:MAG: 3'(2'),5'-bisphosphate nucleotidase [Candidatus Omnitrophota bacterium]